MNIYTVHIYQVHAQLLGRLLGWPLIIFSWSPQCAYLGCVPQQHHVKERYV